MKNRQRPRPGLKVSQRPLYSDPTQTTTLRNAFSTEVRVRFGVLRRNLLSLIIDEDAFGLGRASNDIGAIFNMAPNQPRVPAGSPQGGEWTSGKSKAAVLDSLAKPEKGGTIPNPFYSGLSRPPGTEFAATRKKIEEEGKFEEVKLADLLSFQAKVDAFGVKDFVKDSKLALSGKGKDVDPVKALKTGSGYILYDGNHRAVAALARGETTLSILVLDKEPTANTRWKFNTDPQKIEEFQKWLAEEMKADILPDLQADRWWDKYIELGFKKGAGRSYDDVKKRGKTAGDMDYYNGGKDEFLATSFAQPTTREKLDLLSSRVYTELKGVTEAMAQNLTRALTDGLSQGKSPRQIGADIAKTVDGIGKGRGQTIARTEIVRAHAEGQLDALEAMGVEDLGVMVEWSTTGDAKVCPLCVPLSGIVIKTVEARGMLPRHPNCRCAWVPANVGEDTSKQIRGPVQIAKARNASIQAEDPEATLDEAKADTRWVGADTKFASKRPVSILDDEKPKPVKTTTTPEPTTTTTPAPVVRLPPPITVTTPKPEDNGIIKDPKLQSERLRLNLDAEEAQAELTRLTNEYSRLQRSIDSMKPLVDKWEKAGIDPGAFKSQIESNLADQARIAKELIPAAKKSSDANVKLEEVKQKLKQELFKNLNGDNVLEKLRKQTLKAGDDTNKKTAALLDEKNALKAERDLMWKNGIKSVPALRKLEEIEKKTAEVNDKIRQAMADRNAEVMKALDVRSPQSFEATIGPGLKVTTNASGKSITTVEAGEKVPGGKEFTAKSNEAVKFLSNITDERTSATYKIESHRMTDNERAFYRDSEKAMYLSGLDPVKTHVHEAGHFLEYKLPGVQALANDFREFRIARAGTKDEKMTDVFPEYNYEAYEVGNPDDWIKLFGKHSAYYVGKGYGNRSATEVMSMGLEKLYEDPIGMAEKDPEYFKLVVGALRGVL